MVTYTKLPPGKARGCYDLQRWANNRRGGRYGVGLSDLERLDLALRQAKRTRRRRRRRHKFDSLTQTLDR